MTKMTSGRRYVMIMAVWTLSAILGLTVALAAVGWLGLWVRNKTICLLFRKYIQFL